LGGLINSHQLVEVPIRSHSLQNFSAVIVLDLSQPERLWTDLENALNGLKQACKTNCSGSDLVQLTDRTKEKVGASHPDIRTMELFPFPVVIIGGKYDIFQDIGKLLVKLIGLYCLIYFLLIT
jgi:dynein light intermediate chain 2, cytosolic